MPETPEWMARIADAKQHFENQCVDSADGRRARMAVIGLDALARERELLDLRRAVEAYIDAVRRHPNVVDYEVSEAFVSLLVAAKKAGDK